MMRKQIALSFAMLLIVGLSGFVSALSIALRGDINAYPGETIDASYDIQNLLGSGNLVLEGSFVQGSEVVSFTGNNRINVDDGAIVNIPVRYKIPANAPIGSEYTVQVLFKPVGGDSLGSGNIGFSESVTRTFKITIVEKPASAEPTPTPEIGAGFSTMTGVLIIIVIIVIAVVIWYLIARKKKQ